MRNITGVFIAALVSAYMIWGQVQNTRDLLEEIRQVTPETDDDACSIRYGCWPHSYCDTENPR